VGVVGDAVSSRSRTGEATGFEALDEDTATLGPMRRRRLHGPDELMAALGSAAPVPFVLVRADCDDPAVRESVDAARAAGARIRESTSAVLRRFSPGAPEDVLALEGASPHADLVELVRRPGPVWLLAGVSYPGNAGFAIRTAEVSGAAGIVLDSPLDGAGRRAARRAAMRADWFFPVIWEPTDDVLSEARAAGRRVVAMEDAGGVAPWDADLGGPVLLVVGAEGDGLPEAVLDAADVRVRIPMTGFIPSYNVQAAVASLATELLRRERSEG